jgi:hypothetical protein
MACPAPPRRAGAHMANITATWDGRRQSGAVESCAQTQAHNLWHITTTAVTLQSPTNAIAPASLCPAQVVRSGSLA